MSYGVEIYDSSGGVKYSSQKKTIRSIYTFMIDEGTSSSVTVNEFDSSKGFIGVSAGALDSDGFSYSFNNSTKVFSWSTATSKTQVAFFNIV